MTPLPPELRKAAELCEKATAGPWFLDEQTDYILAGNEHDCQMVAEMRGHGADLPIETNGQFLAEARTALPAALEHIEKVTAENATIKSAWESDLLQWKTEQSKDWATIEKLTAERDANETLYAILRGICEDVIDWRLELMDKHPAIVVSPHANNLFDKLNQMYAHPLDDKLLLRTDQIESAEAKLQTAEATIAKVTREKRRAHLCKRHADLISHLLGDDYCGACEKSEESRKLAEAEATIARLTGGLPDAETLAAKWWEQFEQPIKFSELSAAMQSKLKEDASSWLAALSSAGKGK